MSVQQVEDRAVEDMEKMEDQMASVLDMRAAGYTYRQIAGHLGVDVATAHRRVQRGLARQRLEERETRDDIRDLELAKLAWIERRIMGDAIAGDLKAARFVLACIQCRRMYTKDVPDVDKSTKVEAVAAEFEEWLERNGMSEDAEEETTAKLL